MLKTLDEVKNVQLTPRGPLNEVDDPNLLSVDSTALIPEKVDEAEEKKEEVEEEKESAVEDKPSEEKEEKEEAAKVESASKKPEKDNALDERDGYQRRIDKLTRARRTAERERDFYKEEAEKAKAETEKLKASIPSSEKPKRADFEDDDEYNEALVDWKVEQKVRSLGLEQKKEEKSETKTTAEEESDEDTPLEKTVIVGRKVFEDFDEVVFNKDLPLNEIMVEAALDLENSAEVLYYFGKNPDLSEEIAALSTVKAVRKVEEISRELLGKSKNAETKEEKVEKKVETPAKPKIPGAPAPFTPLETDGVTEKRPEDMSQKEYRAWRERNKQR